MFKKFWNDEHGVVLSAELVLVGTILILGMIVGLVELQCAVVAELSDLGDAIGNVDQSYRIPGMTSFKTGGGVKAQTSGAAFNDGPDAGDCNAIITCDSAVSGGEKSSLSQGTSGSNQGQSYRRFEFNRGDGAGRNIGRPDVRRLAPHSQNDGRPPGPMMHDRDGMHNRPRNAEGRDHQHDNDEDHKDHDGHKASRDGARQGDGHHEHEHEDHDDDRNERRRGHEHDDDEKHKQPELKQPAENDREAHNAERINRKSSEKPEPSRRNEDLI